MGRAPKKARREHRTLLVVDATGHTFRARTGTPWARRGTTPVLRRVSKRREISSLVGITPDGRLAARHFPGAIDSAKVIRKVIRAVRHCQRRLGPRLLLVWDRLNAHRSRRTSACVGAQRPAVAVAYLPAYAPELNPEEQGNAWVERTAENARPGSVAARAALARRGFRRLQRPPALIVRFFRHAGLRC